MAMTMVRKMPTALRAAAKAPKAPSSGGAGGVAAIVLGEATFAARTSAPAEAEAEAAAELLPDCDTAAEAELLADADALPVAAALEKTETVALPEHFGAPEVEAAALWLALVLMLLMPTAESDAGGDLLAVAIAVVLREAVGAADWLVCALALPGTEAGGALAAALVEDLPDDEALALLLALAVPLALALTTALALEAVLAVDEMLSLAAVEPLAEVEAVCVAVTDTLEEPEAVGGTTATPARQKTTAELARTMSGAQCPSATVSQSSPSGPTSVAKSKPGTPPRTEPHKRSASQRSAPLPGAATHELASSCKWYERPDTSDQAPDSMSRSSESPSLPPPPPPLTAPPLPLPPKLATMALESRIETAAPMRKGSAAAPPTPMTPMLSSPLKSDAVSEQAPRAVVSEPLMASRSWCALPCARATKPWRERRTHPPPPPPPAPLPLPAAPPPSAL